LKAQFEVTGNRSKYVFCNLAGEPLDNKNFADRVWYPLLRHLGLKARRPYQMRHTAATLWLASGEAPEWIARQLGHTNTEMLFTTYSRYVPNLTRRDGSAMERLLASKMSQGPLVEQQDDSGNSNYVPLQEVPPLPTPKPRGVYGKPSGRAKADITTIEPIVFKDMASNGNAAEHPTKINSGPADAQPPPDNQPLSWQDMARNWMGSTNQSCQQSSQPSLH
jgi:integrase